MRITRDIQSLSEFKLNASKLIKQVRATKEPMVLTINGKAAVVVQDAESYQEMVDARERAETVAILKKRMEYVRNGGELKTADEIFESISKKFGISFD